MEKEKLVIGINASFARKPQTGMGQVTLNFLRKLIKQQATSNKQQADMEFILYLEEDLPKDIKLPKNTASSAVKFTKKIFLPFWKRDDLIRKVWWEKYLLPKQVKKDGCDVFISLYQCPVTIRLNAKDKKIKDIMLVHDIIPSLFPEYLNNWRKRLYNKLTEQAIRKADKIITVSKRTEKDLIQYLGIEGEKITVNYIDVDPIYKKRVTQEMNGKVLRKYKLKPGYILAGGGLEMRKNVEGVIRAYKFLHDKFVQEKLPPLVIYGRLMPELAPLVTDAEKLLRELNLTKKIKLLGAVEQKYLPALFQNAHMFVYPSHYEGFGMPPLEAMNMGTPVITSKTSSLPEVGLDSVLYCHPDDIRDIAMVMRNVLVNKELRETLSRRGKERAKNFRWDKFVKKMMNICQNH